VACKELRDGDEDLTLWICPCTVSGSFDNLGPPDEGAVLV